MGYNHHVNPPNIIDGARVLEWAWSDEPFGEMPNDDGTAALLIHGLALCRYENSAEIHRFSCDAIWECAQDVAYDSIEDAKTHLPEQYLRVPAIWIQSASIEHQIHAIDWSSFPQPDGNSPTEVRDALLALTQVHLSGKSTDVYNRVLFALGNNHGGTVCPVAIPATEIIANIVLESDGLVRHAAIEVICDLLSFFPEPGFETVPTANGSTAPLDSEVRRTAAQFRKRFEDLRHDSSLTAQGIESLNLILKSISKA